jgi:SAM-dependent methyltransferase
MKPAKEIMKSLAPPLLLHAVRRAKMMKVDPQYKGLPAREVFRKIYEEGVWGKSDDPDQRYYSGDGSHNKVVVDTYVSAVCTFLSELKVKPCVVDLGCGDFHIGSRIRNMCETYIACDIVPELISFNREKYKRLDVDFRVLDIAKDKLPEADVVFVRQVLQHLTNSQIESILPKFSRKYKYLVLTEHLPGATQFTPNLDMAAGAGTRLYATSGIVLTARPFSLKVKEERQLCSVREGSGELRTTSYELA